MDSKIIKYILLIFIFSFKVSAVEFKGKFIQGHYIIGKTNPDTKIFIDKKKVKVSDDGYFAFGIGKDRKFDIIITENNKEIINTLDTFRENIQTNWLYHKNNYT